MTKNGALACGTFALAAVGLALLLRPDEAPPQRPPSEGDPDLVERLQAVEARLAALEQRLAAAPAPSPALLPGSPPAPEALGPAGIAPGDASPPRGEAAEGEAAASLVASSEANAPESPPAASPRERLPVAAVTEEVLGAVDQHIDAAVAAKIAEVERKRNKKPSLDTVTELLELDAYQRQGIEQEVLKGQREIRGLLELPTADGANLVDELVEVMAYGEARRPEAGPMWGRWLQRVMTETIPGTDQTYAARIEAAKGSVREGFRRELSEEQYREFEEWAFDPTEVQDVTDSPWDDLGTRVSERAAALREGRSE